MKISTTLHTSFITLANNIEGDQESELLAEYEAHNKRTQQQQQQQQKMFNSGPRPSMNTLSPNKRRNVGDRRLEKD